MTKITPDAVEVIQSDREKAADLAMRFQSYTYVQVQAPAIRRGEHDDWEIVLSFARYRLELLEAAPQPAGGEPEQVASAWLVDKFGVPEDRDFDCEQMIDAFIAGRESTAITPTEKPLDAPAVQGDYTPYASLAECDTAAIRAVRLLEDAEDFHANCDDCEGEGVPELCGTCFPYFDAARVERRLVMQSLAVIPTAAPIVQQVVELRELIRLLVNITPHRTLDPQAPLYKKMLAALTPPVEPQPACKECSGNGWMEGSPKSEAPCQVCDGEGTEPHPLDAKTIEAAWTCYHCRDTFTDDRSARLHFGPDEGSDAACRIKAGAEQGLVGALRDAEKAAGDAWFAIHNEATDAAKAYHAQSSRHQQQLRVAEEAGYERGLADGRALSAAPAVGEGK